MQSAHVTLFERFLIGLDNSPWHAIFRVALGLGIPPIFQAILGNSNSVWAWLALFTGLLIVLRVIPTLSRRAFPFSPQAQEIWRNRRRFAKQHDSYQWQKLFWIGLGMLPYALVGSELGTGGLVLVVFCLISGGLGLFCWTRTPTLPSENSNRRDGASRS
jgi:hypothetical protein